MKKILAAILVGLLFCVWLPVSAAGRILGDQVIVGGQCDFMWPVKGDYRLSSCFFDYDYAGHKTGHYALDMNTGISKEVVASYDGVVVDVVQNGKGDYGFGNAVMIEHKYQTSMGDIVTLYTRYAHLASYSVKKGQTVSKGDVIGKTGGTANGSKNAYPIHLDYQILTSTNWKKWQKHSIDPYANYLLELPKIEQGWSTACCASYVKQIKKLYANYQPPTYLDKCTFYNANGYITISTKTTIKSLPCSRDTNTNSTDVRSAKKNERYKVIGLYKNTAGNYWYKIGGQVNSYNSITAYVAGYVYAGNTVPVMNGWSGNFSLDGKTTSQNFSSVLDVNISGVYSLAPKCAPGCRLDAANGGTRSGANIRIYASSGSSAQKFRFTKLSNGYYKITCIASGLALDVSGGVALSGTNVQLYTDNGTDAQQWKIVDAGSGYYYIISKLKSNMVLDVWNRESRSGTNVHIWEKNGSSAQLWKLIK